MAAQGRRIAAKIARKLNEPAAGPSLTGSRDGDARSCDADIFIASPIRTARSALKRSLVLAAVIADIGVLPGHF
jgi:hypothetical protein